MASTDLQMVVGALSSGDCARGVTTGTTKPNGGGNFVYGVNSLTNAPGVVALYTTQANFAPMSSGCDISVAMVRLSSGGPTGYSAFMFCALGGTNASDLCYLLGLSDGDPCHVELRKGSLALGLPDETPLGANTILRRSTSTVAVGTWTHLRLEAVVQPFGDVILNCYQSDLSMHSVESPLWVAVPGITAFTDDVLGINTGSAPYTSGRAGFGACVSDVNRRCAFDHLKIARQTAP